MSQPFDLTITGGRIVSGQGVFPATLAIRDGKFAGILAPNESPAAAETIDARGLHILPGLIDTHVHLRDPARPDREDFVSGTSAAAAGGITTILEMPISEPPVNSGEILAGRAGQVQPRALVDFALYGAAGAENIDQIRPMAEAGAIAFKTFLTQPMPERRHEFYGLCCTDDGILLEIMQAVAQTGRRHCFHCEHYPLVERLGQRLQAAGRTDGLAHAESRPPLVEDISVGIVLALAAAVGGPVQIVHMASPRAIEAVKAAKARGLNITAETCPHYLFLTDRALQEHGPYAKCNPALRSAEVVAGIWDYVRDHTIDVLGTDHAPYRPAEKEKGETDIFKAPAGLPGLEAMLPLLLTAVNEGKISLPHVARLVSERAAAIFQLAGKGRIAPGYDADVVLVDLAAAWSFDTRRCFSKAREIMKVYEGRPLKGRVVSTFVRGLRVYEEGQITATPGHGRFLRPA